MNQSKNILLSKTFWLQVIAVLSTFFPVVNEWLAKNPVEFLAVYAALNVLVRFVTSGKVTILGDDESGGASGGMSLLAIGLCMAALGTLPSCTNGQYPLSGTISYQDPESGAKGGLVFRPGKAAQTFLRVPVLDPETGKQVGAVDLRSGK